MEKLSASRDVADHKLLILYVLDRLRMAIGSVDLVTYILSERLMSYLSFQQRIHELIVTKHVDRIYGGSGPRYAITGAGAALLAEMVDLLPRTEKNRVDRTLLGLTRQVINARSVVANYTPEDENNGIVRIELNEGDLSALSLEIATASREEARVICDNWKLRAAEIYAGIVELLLEPRDAEPGERDAYEEV